VTCSVLTDEELLEILQSRNDNTNDSVALQPTKMNLDAAMQTVHVNLFHKENVTNEVLAAYTVVYALNRLLLLK
jgi:hypothetical protein